MTDDHLLALSLRLLAESLRTSIPSPKAREDGAKLLDAVAERLDPPRKPDWSAVAQQAWEAALEALRKPKRKARAK
jgi:hypothetical protein